MPPEQSSGLACSCTIANHHLRGYGRVRWEGEHAIVEDDESDERVRMVNARAHLARANKLSAELARAKERIKMMKTYEEQLRAELKAAVTSKAKAVGRVGAASLSAVGPVEDAGTSLSNIPSVHAVLVDDGIDADGSGQRADEDSLRDGGDGELSA